MTPDLIFKLCSMLAMIGWLVLILLSPIWFHFDRLLIGIVIALLCIVYTWLIATHFNFSDVRKFESLDGVMELFTSKPIVTAGWIHYLAFDLLAGIWIRKNAVKHGIPHLLLVPILLFTFMLGPVGLLLYLLVRWLKTKQYFSENF